MSAFQLKCLALTAHTHAAQLESFMRVEENELASISYEEEKNKHSIQTQR